MLSKPEGDITNLLLQVPIIQKSNIDTVTTVS